MTPNFLATKRYFITVRNERPLMLAYKNISLTSNDKNKNIQTLISTYKTTVIQSKSIL